MLEQLEAHQYQPNDTYLALSSSFHIITGQRAQQQHAQRHTSCRNEAFQFHSLCTLLGLLCAWLFAPALMCHALAP